MKSYDIFFSYNSKDRDIVEPLAQRLKADGLRIWLDVWEMKGESNPAKIEEGLEDSSVLVLCMSANAFGSDWTRLESQTFRFRDPLNKDRRLILVRLDNSELKGSLAQFSYVDWRRNGNDSEYQRLLEACKPVASGEAEGESLLVLERVMSLGHTGPIRSVALSGDGKRALSASDDKTVRLWDVENGRALRVFEGHRASVWSVAWSGDGKQALSASDDKTVRLWDVESGRTLRVFEGLSGWVWSVAWSGDGKQALSGSADSTVRLWDVESGCALRVFEGHRDRVWSVAWSGDGKQALSGSDDSTVRLWDVESGRALRVLEGHRATVWSVAWSGDGKRALSGSADSTMRLWDVESGRALQVFEGHSGWVWSVAWSRDGKHALSASDDKTVRLWDVESGRALRVFEGHRDRVWSVAWSGDGKRALSGSDDKMMRLWDVESGRTLRVFEGRSGRVRSVAWSGDGKRALSASDDKMVRLWDVESGRALRIFEEHRATVRSVAWSGDGMRALSGSDDSTVQLWDVESGRALRVFEGHRDRVWSVAWSGDGKRALSGSADSTVRLWDVESGRALRVFEGHRDRVWSVAWSGDGKRALSASADSTVRLWDVESGRALQVFEGHSGWVWSVAWSGDGKRALSASEDKTVRLWDVESGRTLRVFEGHSDSVLSVAWSGDGKRALSGSDDSTVRLWDVESGRTLRVFEGHSDSVLSVAWSADESHAFSAAGNGVLRWWRISGAENMAGRAETARSAHVQYTNAKVLLVGDSGAGKTGLSQRLALDDWEPSDSTVGAWAMQWKLPVLSSDGVEREIWLWDFGGQADQRLIHQLYMEDTAVAVLVFDGQQENLFESLGHWDRDLVRASRHPFTKLLVAGRVDAGGLRSSRSQVEMFAKERGFAGYLETSAKSNSGCDQLKKAILDGIKWAEIPFRSSPRLFKLLKDEIVLLKDEGLCLLRFNELRDMLRLRLRGHDAQFTDEELKAVVGLLVGPGVVWELPFGGWVLLQPERIDAYGQAVIQTLRADPQERGLIREEKVLAGKLNYQSSMQRLSLEEERFVLLAMHQTLVERALCLREHTEAGTLLIFPSYFRRERPEIKGHPSVWVSYRFNGFLDDIYATLVVRLHHTKSFTQDQLWRYAADFKTQTGKQLGIKLERKVEGSGELELYFDATISMEEKIIFSGYVHEHILQKGQAVQRTRHYVCGNCHTPLGNSDVAKKRLEVWLENKEPAPVARKRTKSGGDKKTPPTIICVECEKRISLWDELEQLFASDEVRQRVHDLQKETAVVLDNESKERALVGEVISTVALAGQISREFNVSDHGIDMEIEFKSDAGEATGQKLYLQLKSGDSYLRERKSDESEVFTIKDERHVRYWTAQAFPVMLVIRNSRGEVRWMEVRDWLRNAARQANEPVKQIIFDGERFDVMSVRRWRDQVLSGLIAVKSTASGAGE